MLQLLLEGGQGYAEIGSLLGISAEEVRSRARKALAEIGGADPDAQVPISDYLLGQADPIGRADAVRHLQSDPEANALAERLVAQLRLLAPKAQLPEIPSARGARKAPTPPPAAPESPPPATTPGQAPPPAPPTGGPSIRERLGSALRRLSRSRRQSQIAVALGAGTLLIVAIVLAVSGAFGGDDDGGGGEDCAEIDTAQAQQAGIPTIGLQAIGPAANADCPPTGQITLAPLQPQQGQNQNQTPQFALQMNAAELEPTGNGEGYVLWLYRSDTEAFPLGQQTVDASGNLTGGVPLAAQQLLLLQAFQSLRLSRVDAAQQQQIQQSLQNQGRRPVGVVAFVGEPALEGAISELGLDQLLQQAQGQGGGAGGQGGQGGQAPQGGNAPQG